MKASFPFSLRQSVLCSLVAILAAPGARAADGTWTQITGGSANGTWSDEVPGNWAAGVVAGGSGATANFATLDVSGTSTITLGEPRTIGNLIFGDTGTSSAATWVLAGSGGNTLSLQGTTPTITVGSATNTVAIISTSISGNDGLTKNGAGILVLSGSNNYSGGTTISQGVLRAQNSAALGSGEVTVTSGARLQLHGGVNLSNTINLNGSSALFVNSGSFNVLSGLVNLQSNSTVTSSNGGNNSLNFTGTVNLNANTLTVSTVGTNNPITIDGVIMGSGGITKQGAGALTISGDQTATYSGVTTLLVDTLALGHDGALGTGTLALNVNSDGSGTIRSTDTTARTLANAVTISGGNSNSIYRFGSTAVGSNGNLTFTNTTAINLPGAVVRKFEVRNRTQFDAGFTGGGGITMQTNSGTLVLNGENTYTGATTVNAGTLLVNGSLSASSTVTVGIGGTLGGGGTVGGNTTILGVLAPGSSTESLAFGNNVTLTSTANTIIEINGLNRGAAADGYDGIDLTNVSGILTYDGTLTLTMTGLIANGVYDIFSFTADAQGGFDSVVFAGGAYTGTFSESEGIWSSTSDQGQVFTFNQATGDLTVVPEPATAMMIGAGLMTVLFVRRRSRQS